MTIREFSIAQSMTTKPVKGMLTGPVTILNWSFPREDVSREVQAMQIALAIRDEISDLEAAVSSSNTTAAKLYGIISIPCSESKRLRFLFLFFQFQKMHLLYSQKR